MLALVAERLKALDCNPLSASSQHIVPISKGGATSWMNLVAACKACNNRKANRTPEAAGMKLHYVPYVPNRYEAFILSHRKILADQMEPGYRPGSVFYVCKPTVDAITDRNLYLRAPA